MSTRAARATQDRDPPTTVQQRCQLLEIALLGNDHWPGRQEASGLWCRRVSSGLQRDVARDHNHRDAAFADRLADRNFEHTGHLVCAGDQLAVVAALFEQCLRVGFLEISGADFGRRDLGSDGEHRHARSVTIEEAIYQMQIAGPAAAGTHGKFARQMRLSARRKGGDFLDPDMHPFDLALPPNGVGQAIQAVADDAVGPLDTGCRKGFHKLIGNRFCHLSLPCWSGSGILLWSYLYGAVR